MQTANSVDVDKVISACSSTGDWVRGDDSEQYTEVLKHLVENIVVLKSKDCHRLHQ